MKAAGPNVEPRARFHYNSDRPEEPWHITVDFGNRNSWDNGNGFFRRGYHIYAKNNDLSQGYAGYSSPIQRNAVGRIDQEKHREYLPLSGRNDDEPGTSTSSVGPEATGWVPWGTRDYYRNPTIRGSLHRTTHRTLQPPTALSEAEALRTHRGVRRPLSTGVREGKPMPSLQDDFADMISQIHDGTLKTAPPSKGEYMVPDFSGNFVHISQAVSDAREAGKEIPVAWRVILKSFHAKNRLAKTARTRSATRAQLAIGKSRRTMGPTARSREGALKSKALKSKGLEGTEKSSRPRSKMRAPLDEGLGARQARPGTERPQLNGSSTNKDDGEAKLNIGPRVSAGPPRPRKSEAAKPRSRPKLTIRDPFETEAGVTQGVSAPGQLSSGATRENGPGSWPEDGKFESKGRSRRNMRRPQVEAKHVDLGQVLMDAAPEPVVSIDYRQWLKASRPPSGGEPARPRPKRYQKSELGSMLLNHGNPVAGESAPSSRNRRPKESVAQKDGSDARKVGGQTRSPLPPSDADFVSEGGEKMKGQRPKQRRAPKPTPAWVLPRSAQQATSGELHA